MSYPQLRKRLDSLARLDGLFTGQVGKGEHGRLEYSGAVLEMLRDLDSLARNADKELDQAAREIAENIQGKRITDNDSLASKRVNLQVDLLRQRLEDKEERINELKERIEELRSEIAFLRSRIEELTPLALPRPRRWLAWLWPTRGKAIY